MAKHFSEFRPSEIPAKPGVYVYRDKFGTVIYVGKAANLRRRMSQYFQPSRVTRADPKLRSLIHSIETWEFFTVRNEDESLILESRFIKEYSPHYNILLRDDKRYPLLKIDPGEKFPRLKLTRITRNDSCRYFGPFPHGSALRKLQEILSREFGLRTCKTDDPGPEDRKHCLAGTVRDCCRPCTGEIGEEEYRKKVDSLIAALTGDSGGIIARLEEHMREEAAKNRFEKAALLRDVIANLRELPKLRAFSRAQLPADAGMEAVRDLQEVLHLEKLPRVIVGFDISNIAGTLAVASMVRFEDGCPDKAGYRRFRIRTVTGSNDFAMMHEVIKRHFSRLLEEKRPLPDLLLIDGGKGQLSYALRALCEISCPPFPVLGLAERHEEIYLPGRTDPVIVPLTRPAINLLRALRDEAHRFAVTYHRELRMKKITESVLDEIAGLGEVRKQALLRVFGSVAALRKAAPEEIARKVRGIGEEFSRTIADFLKRRFPDT